MAVTYSPNLRLSNIASGTENGNWGNLTDVNICDLIEQAITGQANINLVDNGAPYTLVMLDGAKDEARCIFLNFYGTLTQNKKVVIPASPKPYYVINQTSGTGTLSLVAAGGSSERALVRGRWDILWSDGTYISSILQDTLLNYLPLTGNAVINIQDPAQNGLSIHQAAGQTAASLALYRNDWVAMWYAAPDGSTNQTGQMTAASGYVIGDFGVGINLTVHGSTNHLGTIYTSGGIYVDGWTGKNFGLYREDIYNYSKYQDNWFWQFNTQTGTLLWHTYDGHNTVFGPDGTLTVPNNIHGLAGLIIDHDIHIGGSSQFDGNINCSKDAAINGDIHCHSLYAGGAVSAGSSDYAMFITSNNRFIQFAGDWKIRWDSNNGYLSWIGYGIITDFAPEGSFLLHSGQGYKPGGGLWGGVAADRRLSERVEPFVRGLDAILHINPIIYSYRDITGFDPTKRYIGVDAQDIQPFIPETVSVRDPRFRKLGTVEFDDILEFDGSALTYALINAVKELNAEVQLLKEQLADLRSH